MSVENDIPDPQLMDLEEWQRSMLLTFPEAELPYPDPNWQRWGVSLYSRPGFGDAVVPDPYLFGDWRPWAAQLREGVA